MSELNEPEQLWVIENAWLNNHATEQPRNAAEDIRFLLMLLKRGNEYRRDLERTSSKAFDDQRKRSEEFARVALKNGNALLMSEARIRFLEQQLDDVLKWAENQHMAINHPIRSILNEYIEDDQKHTTSPS